MSQEVHGGYKTFDSGADLTGKRYYMCKQDTSGDVVLAAAATDVIIGILDDAPTAAGEAVPVRLRNDGGTAKVIASTTIAIGAKVTATSGGKAVTTTTDKDEVVGIALEAAGADGDIIEILLCNYTLSHA